MNLQGKDNLVKWRKPAFFLSITAMLGGLLFSRALLSSGLIFFAFTSLFHKNIIQQLKDFFTSPVLWAMSLLFVLPAISGFWSENISQWAQILRIKLPLLLLPVCFAGEINFKCKDWEKISLVFLGIMFAGICWSLWQYFQNINDINAAYLKAYTIETPLGNDHVRFSLLVVIGVSTSVFLLMEKGKSLKKVHKARLLILAISQLVYLHVLAVRTGLICFYVGVFIFLIWLVSQHKRKSYLLIFIFLLPITFYFILPTFRNKIHYLKYDLSFVQQHVYQPGSSDGNRFASIKAGWMLVKQSPVVGVGFGDIKNEVEKFYDANFPQMSENDRILPSSEWMIYGSGTGWPGLILFSFAMLFPLFVKKFRKNIFWISLNIFIAFSYLFDIGLEVQFGVFVHSFMLLWWYKWLQLKE